MSEVEELAHVVFPHLISHDIVTDNMVQTFYSDNAHLYDAIFAPDADIYHGPAQGADAIKKYFPSSPDINILDLCCGTGVFAYELKKRGFANIDGLDACENMLRGAREKKLYRDVICAYFGSENDPTPDGFYDVVCICGGFMPGHIPAAGLETMAKKVKKGGIVVNIMRDAYLDHPFYKDNFWPAVKSLEDRRIVERGEITKTEKYYEDYTGILFVFRVL